MISLIFHCRMAFLPIWVVHERNTTVDKNRRADTDKGGKVDELPRSEKATIFKEGGRQSLNTN